MSIETGAVCYKCKKWHSHFVEDKRVYEGGRWRIRYICVNCKHDIKEVKNGARG